jgi:hypothetical protein
MNSGLLILIGPYPSDIKYSEHNEELLLGTIKDTLSPASKKLLRKNPSYSRKIFNSRLSIFL